MYFCGIMLFIGGMAGAQNIDPDDDGSRYAYSENVGWVNFRPSTGAGVMVSDDGLTGFAWGENVGWINLDPLNGGVINDGYGNLSGYAWSENTGWISFSCENTADCASVDYRVTIDPLTGEFGGRAWGENIGWVTFSAATPVSYGVRTSWLATAYLCEGDFAPADGDVDGADLALVIDSGGIEIDVFAEDFGRIDCPQ